MPRTTKTMFVPRSPTHAEIARCAYDIFVERGSVHGFDREHWFEAEQLLVAAGETPTTVLSDDYARTPPKRSRRPAGSTAPPARRRRTKGSDI